MAISSEKVIALFKVIPSQSGFIPRSTGFTIAVWLLTMALPFFISSPLTLCHTCRTVYSRQMRVQLSLV